MIHPPFNEASSCVKCGGRKASAAFLRAPQSGLEEEAIRRVCSRCGYDWLEATLDSVGPPGLPNEEAINIFIATLPTRARSALIRGYGPEILRQPERIAALRPSEVRNLYNVGRTTMLKIAEALDKIGFDVYEIWSIATQD